MLGEKNVANPLVLLEKIYLPHLHIKLGFIKTLWKVWIKPTVDSNMWGISSQMWQKIKEGVFIGPQISKLMQDKQFDEDLNETKRNVWLSFKRICKDFLGNHKAADYQDIVQDLLTSHKAMGCNMSLKIHFLKSHLSNKIVLATLILLPGLLSSKSWWCQ